jgi:hypothetical protein
MQELFVATRWQQLNTLMHLCMLTAPLHEQSLLLAPLQICLLVAVALSCFLCAPSCVPAALCCVVCCMLAAEPT